MTVALITLTSWVLALAPAPATSEPSAPPVTSEPEAVAPSPTVAEPEPAPDLGMPPITDAAQPSVQHPSPAFDRVEPRNGGRRGWSSSYPRAT